jgi:hypothetical protein
MRPIGQKYNDKTIDAAKRVQKHLQDNYELHFNRAFKTQGSVVTGTNIRVHSDFDLLTIIDKYYFNPPGTTTDNAYTASNPDEDIVALRNQSIRILKGIYDDVNDKGEKSISIFNKSLNRKVDIVFCFWYHSDEFNKSKDEFYKGVYLYRFPSKEKVRDFPFATIANVNTKGTETIDGSRKAIRLLKNLKADADNDIFLSSFQLTSLVHSMHNSILWYKEGGEMSIAQAVSLHIDKICNDSAFRKAIKSPNGIELPFIKDDTVQELEKLNRDLTVLISDTSTELLKSTAIQKALLTY